MRGIAKTPQYLRLWLNDTSKATTSCLLLYRRDVYARTFVFPYCFNRIRFSHIYIYQQESASPALLSSIGLLTTAQ